MLKPYEQLFPEFFLSIHRHSEVFVYEDVLCRTSRSSLLRLKIYCLVTDTLKSVKASGGSLELHYAEVRAIEESVR